MCRMYTNHTHQIFQLQCLFFIIAYFYSFFNPLSSIGTSHKFIGVESSTWVLTIFQWPHFQRKEPPCTKSFWVEGGTLEHPTPILESLTGSILCRSCVGKYTTINSCEEQPCPVQKVTFCSPPHFSQLLCSFCTLSWDVPWPLRAVGIDTEVSSMAEHS